jgi:nucleotide-binding universal stress UspA family protein
MLAGMTTAIISYDDTLNDYDALALGRLLGQAGAELMLAYVRHTTQQQRTREELEEHEAWALLERGARWLDDLDVERRVVVSASTGAGLRWLAEHEEADIVVFGSDYRTAAGRVSPQRSAQALLEGGPAAVAIAPGNYRAPHDQVVGRIGVMAGAGDESALTTAQELAERFSAQLTNVETECDLLVVGSRPEAAPGQVMITAQAQNAIENARQPVLILARGVALTFQAPLFIG